MHQPPSSNPSLWDFACWLYQQDKVKEACLKLQNEHSADVNLLLFCCWHGVTRGSIQASLWPKLLEYSKHWQDTLQPLRALRKTFKQKSYPKIYQQFLELELACEHTQLKQMEAFAPPEQPQSNHLQICELNLRHYLGDTLGLPKASLPELIEPLIEPLLATLN